MKPDAVSRCFARLRKRIGLDRLDFHYLRKFMETYGQEMGYSVSQVALELQQDPVEIDCRTRARPRGAMSLSGHQPPEGEFIVFDQVTGHVEGDGVDHAGERKGCAIDVGADRRARGLTDRERRRQTE